MSQNATDTGATIPYIAFKTLRGMVETMAADGPPSRIDKSYLGNFSGGYQTQVLAALTSLGLIDEAGTMSTEFKALVAGDEETRKAIVADLVRSKYARILAEDKNATQQQMIDAFTDLAPGIKGDTRRKAIAFFLQAASYAGVSVSKYWKTPGVQRNPNRPKTPTGREATPEDDEDGGDEGDKITGKPNLKELTLRSGGSIGLSISVDLFALSPEDRNFVFEIVDKMSAYEAARQLPPGDDDQGGPDEEDDS